MLEMKFIRENAEVVRENLRRRKDEEKLRQLDRLLELDEKIRTLNKKIQDLRTDRNRISREVGKRKKAGNDDSDLVAKANAVNDSIGETEAETGRLEKQLKRIQMTIPNMLHESVPYGASDEDNEVVREWGGKPTFDFEIKSHVDLLDILDVGDIPRAAKISGARFYFLKNELVILDLAMQHMALDMLAKKGFTSIYPPFMIHREPYEGVTDLADFE